MTEIIKANPAPKLLEVCTGPCMSGTLIQANTPERAVALWAELHPLTHIKLWVFLGTREEEHHYTVKHLFQRDEIRRYTVVEYLYEVFVPFYSEDGWKYLSKGNVEYVPESEW